MKEEDKNNIEKQLEFDFNVSSNTQNLNKSDNFLTVLSLWNGGFITNESKSNFGEIASWDLDKHCNFYIWNFLITFLNDLKNRFKDDIKEINLLIIYGLCKVSIEKELKILGINLSSSIPSFDKLLLENISLALNDLSLYDQDDQSEQIKRNLNKYWSKSFKNLYDVTDLDSNIPFLKNRSSRKLSVFPKEKLEVNKTMNQNEFIKKLNDWSDNYEKNSQKIAGFNFKSLKDTLIEYDWDTRFLWLSNHLSFISFWENLDEMYSDSIVSAYGKTITNLSTTLEKLNIDFYEAVTNIPNLFIRTFDYLVEGFGAKFLHDDHELNISQKKTLYSYFASDFLLKPTKENTLNSDLLSVLGITFKCSFHENGLKKANMGDLSGAIKDFTNSIIAHPNQPLSYFDRGLARKLSKNYKGAIDDYSKVIELNKKMKGKDNKWTESIYLDRGFCRFLEADDEGAVEDYTKAINFNPESYIAYGRRGIVKDFIGNHKDAILDFSKSIEFYNEKKDSELNMIVLHEKRGMSKFASEDFKGAKFDFNEAILINNKKSLYDDFKIAELYEKLGCINTCLSERDEALLSFSRAIDLNPKLLSAYGLKAEYLYRTFKDSEAALLCCEKALNLGIEEPEIIHVLYVKSNIKINTEIPEEAIEAIRDINKMINLHERFYHDEKSLDKKLGEYYLLKAKAKSIISGYGSWRSELIQASELGNIAAKEILEELDQRNR